MATKTIKTPGIMEKILKHALFILPFLLNNNLCQNFQIWKRPTKLLKSQIAVVLTYPFDVFIKNLK